MKFTKVSHTDNNQELSDTNARIFDFLKTKNVGVLSTVDPNADPHAAVVYYSVDDRFNTYFTTKKRTKKSDNLQHNNHAMIIVYDEATQTTVQITGEVSEVTDIVKTDEIFRATLHGALKTSETGVPPISKLSAGDYVAYVLQPTRVRMAVYMRPESGAHTELFEEAELS